MTFLKASKMSEEDNDEIVSVTNNDRDLVVKMGTVAANIVSKVSGLFNNVHNNFNSKFEYEKDPSFSCDENQCDPETGSKVLSPMAMSSQLCIFKKLCNLENQETTKTALNTRLKGIKTNRSKRRLQLLKNRSQACKRLFIWKSLQDFASIKEINEKISFKENSGEVEDETIRETDDSNKDKVS